MSQHPTYVIFAGKSAWQVCAPVGMEDRFIDVPIDPSASAARIGELVAAALRGAGYAGGATLLALPAAWCYAATISLAGLPRNDRKAMLYRLEEGLPFAAEGLAADFLPYHRATGGKQSSDTALGICCRTDVLQPLLTELESHGVAVQSVCPADLLTAQEITHAANEDPRVVLCAECEPGVSAVNVFGFEAGMLTRWSRAADRSQLRLQVNLVSGEMEESPAVQSLDVDGGLQAGVADFTARHADQTRAAAARMGRQVLLGKSRPWVELRRGPLAAGDRLTRHRAPLNAALASAVLLLVVLGVVLAFRARRYSQLEQSARRQIVAEFQQHFPGWAIPPNVKAIVESEHRKAAALATGALPPQARMTALRTMLDVLGHLPAEDRLTVDKLSFADSSFELQGEIRAYEQVDAIAAAVRQAGVDVPAPEARKTPAGTWTFILRGAYRGPSVAKGG